MTTETPHAVRALGAHAIKAGYPYEVGAMLFACEAGMDDGKPPQGVCEGCWYARFGQNIPGAPYTRANDSKWEEILTWYCPDCAACEAVQEDRIRDLRRWPVLVLVREADGSVRASSQRGVSARTESGAIVLQATTSAGDNLPPVRVTDLNLVEGRRAYAQLVRELDAADPLPAVAVPRPRGDIAASLPLNDNLW